ncbi:MAG: hypothetical protein WC679_12510 [Bacteroidales bacterium]|jgi:hypothetical protein
MLRIFEPFIIIFIILFCLPSSIYGQNNSLFYQNPKIDSNDIKKLYLVVDNFNFFKDNEFKAEKVSGYTLPGFRLSPKLSIVLYKNILLEAGVHILHYWGANKYPCYSYLDISSWQGDQYQKGIHLLPLFRAQVSLKDNLQLVFGNLYLSNNHNLILPLYNTELNLSSDPETGIQLLYDSKYFVSDLWVNWQSFIFRNDTHQEVFDFGVSTKTDIINLDNKLQLYIPLQLIAQHRGGELDTIYSNNIQTLTNFAGGIGINYKFDKFVKYIGFESFYAGFIKNTGTSIPFNDGYGIYNKISIGIKDFNINFSYWVSEDFVSIYGSPHFGNISTNTPNLVFDKMQMLLVQIDYSYKIYKDVSIGFEGNLIYYFPFTGDRVGYVKVVRNNVLSFSFGIYLKLNPRFKIKG